MAANVYFHTANHLRNPKTKVFGSLEKLRPIFIGKRCWIGTKVIMLPGASVGDYSTVGASAVVTKQFLENGLIVGNPAVLKKTYQFSEIDEG